MYLPKWTLVAAILCFAYVVANEVPETKGSVSIFFDGPCFYNQFRCSNDKCIAKSDFCNGFDDCGDNSDEQFCEEKSCPEKRFRCYRDYYSGLDKCIPFKWVCDGEVDCKTADDEKDCALSTNSLSLFKIIKAKRNAVEWIRQSRNGESLSHKWGLHVARKAIAWYLADEVRFQENTTVVNELVYEISLGLLSQTSSKKLKDISSLKLATYVNAFLVTCIDPRRFYGMDLVSELRERVEASNETHPSVILALCNANDQVSKGDVTKTVQAFWDAERNNRTDIEALAVLALSCVAEKHPSTLEDVDTSELTMELKQYRYGTVESLKTRALTLQALHMWETEADENNFNVDDALGQILKHQREDGSFGNMANTYYVLPPLSHSSLATISSSHCASRDAGESDALQELQNRNGHKSSVRYSLWIGNDRTMQSTITLKVSSNTSFFGVMEWAAKVNNHFRFEYSIREMKPYIYSISGMQDDPENNTFWFLYAVGDSDKRTLITQSPSDVIPRNGQHLVFWYQTE